MEQTITIRGEDPHRYATARYHEFRKEAYVNIYNLVTSDSFEIGGAYSLHGSKHEAKIFSPRSWWRANSKGLKVFVSEETAEAIERKFPIGIFRSWEN